MSAAEGAVAEEARRCGLGTALLQAVHGLAEDEELVSIDLTVREANVGAQLAYQRAGYRAVEILHGFYGDEDGYRMLRELADGDVGD